MKHTVEYKEWKNRRSGRNKRIRGTGKIGQEE
jgi:hypothetical protein